MKIGLYRETRNLAYQTTVQMVEIPVVLYMQKIKLSVVFGIGLHLKSSTVIDLHTMVSIYR